MLYCSFTVATRIMNSHMLNCSVQPWNTITPQFTMWLDNKIENWSQKTHFCPPVSSRVARMKKDRIYCLMPSSYMISLWIPSEYSLKKVSYSWLVMSSRFPWGINVLLWQDLEYATQISVSLWNFRKFMQH